MKLDIVPQKRFQVALDWLPSRLNLRHYWKLKCVLRIWSCLPSHYSGTRILIVCGHWAEHPSVTRLLGPPPPPSSSVTAPREDNDSNEFVGLMFCAPLNTIIRTRPPPCPAPTSCLQQPGPNHFLPSAVVFLMSLWSRHKEDIKSSRGDGEKRKIHNRIRKISSIFSDCWLVPRRHLPAWSCDCNSYEGGKVTLSH